MFKPEFPPQGSLFLLNDTVLVSCLIIRDMNKTSIMQYKL